MDVETDLVYSNKNNWSFANFGRAELSWGHPELECWIELKLEANSDPVFELPEVGLNVYFVIIDGVDTCMVVGEVRQSTIRVQQTAGRGIEEGVLFGLEVSDAHLLVSGTRKYSFPHDSKLASLIRGAHCTFAPPYKRLWSTPLEAFLPSFTKKFWFCILAPLNSPNYTNSPWGLQFQ